MKSTAKRNAFTERMLLVLVNAMADQNYRDAEVIVTALAKAHGIASVSPTA